MKKTIIFLMMMLMVGSVFAQGYGCPGNDPNCGKDYGKKIIESKGEVSTSGITAKIVPNYPTPYVRQNPDYVNIDFVQNRALVQYPLNLSNSDKAILLNSIISSRSSGKIIYPITRLTTLSLVKKKRDNVFFYDLFTEGSIYPWMIGSEVVR